MDRKTTVGIKHHCSNHKVQMLDDALCKFQRDLGSQLRELLDPVACAWQAHVHEEEEENCE